MGTKLEYEIYDRMESQPLVQLVEQVFTRTLKHRTDADEAHWGKWLLERVIIVVPTSVGGAETQDLLRELEAISGDSLWEQCEDGWQHRVVAGVTGPV